MSNLPENAILTREKSEAIQVKAAKVFQPRTPIATRDLFAGRWNQITTLADAVGQIGLHVIIYGERGVGKTSLANIVRPLIWAFDEDTKGQPISLDKLRPIVKANANRGDSFSSVWHKLLAEIQWENNRPVIGMHPPKRDAIPLREAFKLPPELTPGVVRKIVSMLPGSVFIVDEFDRAIPEASTNFTDLVKELSDFAVDCTVILVGVADTVDHLIADHTSISRALVQIMVPRMEEKELMEILRNAEKSLEIKFSKGAVAMIVHISQGLPHYTHLLGLHSVRLAAGQKLSGFVQQEDVFSALKAAVKQAEQAVTQKHSKAIHSAHKDALYRHVLLACALTAAQSHDALGYFTPRSIVGHLSSIMRKEVEIATFSHHLNEFCQQNRGPILEREGQPRSYRFRFHDPLLVPYVFMDAVAAGLVTHNQLSELLGSKF